MNRLYIENTTSHDIPSQDQFEAWFKAAIGDAEATANIVVVDANTSAQYNNDYRGKDKPTNVLSFEFEKPEFVPVEETNYLLGDLIICAVVVEKEALDQNKVQFDHWAHMVVHGTLHLMGYDHIKDNEAEEMEALERKILASLNIKDPYLGNE